MGGAASTHLEVHSRWGLLPFAVVLAAVGAARLGAIALPNEPPRMRALFGAIGGVAVIAVGVRVMGALGVLSQDGLFGALAATALVLFVVRREDRLGVPWAELVTKETFPVAAAAIAAAIVAMLAAYWLPVWQWDALGYHLPYVNFALQHGTLADVPDDVPYITTYPHVVELYFIGWRAMIPDDRLVDAAQIPLGLAGAGAVACLARELGARTDHAVAAGLAWLTVPAVFLQLPTNYIDVAAAGFLLAGAAFTLAPPTPRNVLAAGVALGLFLGSKPNAPVGTALVFAALALRGLRAGRRGALALSAVLVVLLGAESYVANLVHHGNPVWPVRVTLGPIALPGTLPMQALLDSGAAAPRLHGPLLSRVVRSWTALDAPPVFDMRYGGLGLVFLAALVAAGFAVRRRRALALPLTLIAAATLASPDPAVPRYILAFPGLVLALAAAHLTTLRVPVRRIALGAAGGVAAVAIVRVAPALAGEGPPLAEYPALTEEDRLRAVGANGTPAPFYDALERLGPEERAVFDASFDLPYLAWPPDLSRAAARIPDDVGEAEAERIVGDPNVRLLIVDRDSPVAAAARTRGDDFTPLFECRSASCVVFFRN